MTRDELIQITHKLGYDYVWQDMWGTWQMGRNRPQILATCRPYWFLYESVQIFATVEFDGEPHQTMLFYGDTLAKSMEDQYTETENRG